MVEEVKVLVVDDEADFANLMAFNLKSKGYSVMIASNANEAIKKFKEDSPDIAFLDVILPDTDGIELLKKIREVNKKTPVIIMSAYMRNGKFAKQIDFHGISGIFYIEYF